MSDQDARIIRPSARRSHFYVLLALQFVAIVLIGAQDIPSTVHAHRGDLWIYFQDSGQLLCGKMPYRDFALEYPPLALAAFSLPRFLLGGLEQNFTNYLWAFLAQSALMSTALAVCICRLAKKNHFGLSPDLALGAYCGLVILTSYYLPWRYDLFPALLTALAFGALLSGRPLSVGLWLGLGTAAKLYPAFLLPLFFLFALSSQPRPNAWKMALGFVPALGVCFLPFATLPPPVLLSFLKYHQLRGLEIESVPAGMILAAHSMGLTPASVIVNYGADHLVSPAAPPVIRCLPAVFGLLYGGALWKARQTFQRENELVGKAGAETLLLCLVSSLLAFILANKVFSPQYLLWVMPFVPLLRPRRILWFCAIFLLTTAVYPYSFASLCLLSPGAILLVNLRNALALALFASLLFRPNLMEKTSALWARPQEITHAAS